MGIILNLFGHTYRVRFEFTLENGTVGTGKATVRGAFIDQKDIEDYIKEYLYVELGKRATSAKIIALI